MYGTEKTMVILGIVMSLLLGCASGVFCWFKTSDQATLITELKDELTQFQASQTTQLDSLQADITLTQSAVDSISDTLDDTNATLEDLNGRITDVETTPKNLWISGTGAPSSTLGNVGDWYLNLTTCDLYEKIGTSSWVFRVCIKGASGPQGPPGP